MENLVKLLSDDDKEKLRKVLHNEYYSKYRKQNREIINKHNGRPVTCEYCDSKVNKWNLPKHYRSWKCMQSRINKNDQTEINNQESTRTEEPITSDNDLTEEYKSDN